MKGDIHVDGWFMGPGGRMQADILSSKYLALSLTKPAFVQLKWLVYAPINPLLRLLITTKNKQKKCTTLFSSFLSASKGADFLFSSYTDIGAELLTN